MEIEEFLKYLVSLVIDTSGKVSVEKKIDNELIIFTVSVPEEEVGKLIGKEGKVINSLRCLARLKGLKKGLRILVKIGNQSEKGSSLPTITGSSTIA